MQAITNSQHQTQKEITELAAIVKKLANQTAKQEPINLAITTHTSTSFDPATVPATRQALFTEFDQHLADGVKTGASAAGRALLAATEKRFGRKRTA